MKQRVNLPVLILAALLALLAVAVAFSAAAGLGKRPASAQIEGSLLQELATSVSSYGEEAVPAPQPVDEPAEAAPDQEVDWNGTAQKWVPIFSLESGGVYLGAAQIAGPPAQVAKVKGVAEMRLNFQNLARIYAYIPVSTISLTKLDRVQGVSVWATGDLRLVKF
jgi:hypothetical protein